MENLLQLAHDFGRLPEFVEFFASSEACSMAELRDMSQPKPPRRKSKQQTRHRTQDEHPDA
ncbi:MAG: hypothetical protein D3910_27720 [Candidatus Electrothrix sp. ATG2]|nr:hypothetical protein [Candidatus Electrothrix sp. ATG2]